jgi:hypothetical protein
VCEEPISQKVIKKTFIVYGTPVFKKKKSVALRKPFSPYFKEKTNEHMKLIKMIVKEHKLSCMYNDWLF